MKAIRTRYLGPPDFKGSRIVATDEDGNRAVIGIPPLARGEAVHKKAALALCDKLDWGHNLIGGGLKDGYVFVFADGIVDALAAVSESATEDYTISPDALIKVRRTLGDIRNGTA